MIKRISTISAVLLLAACAQEEPFPAIVTEVADVVTDKGGRLDKLVTDDDRCYTISTPQTGLKASTAYRELVGYTTEGDQATLYSLKPVYMLHDSSFVATRDPLAVVSAWSTRHYVNLHLAPKTQGGRHYYGYSIDRINLHGPARLTLHHRQGTDPSSYTDDVYASILWTELGTDSIVLTITTFDGEKQFNLKKKE